MSQRCVERNQFMSSRGVVSVSKNVDCHLEDRGTQCRLLIRIATSSMSLMLNPITG